MFDKILHRLKGVTVFLIAFLVVSAVILIVIDLSYHSSLELFSTLHTSENIMCLCVSGYFVANSIVAYLAISKQNKIQNTLVYYKNLFLWLPIMLLINVGLFFVARYALQPSDKLKADLRQSVQHYMKVDAVLRMDKIQTSMMCCGVYGWDDYKYVLEGGAKQVQSCCSVLYGSEKICEKENAYPRGCLDVYENYFQNLQITLVIFLSGSIIAVLAAMVLMLAFYLKFRQGVLARNKAVAVPVETGTTN